VADPRVINGGGNEWYTPPQYIEAAREVMGGIDLDPASNDIAAQWINATSYYTITDNGLAKSWEGRVWMNPPYSQPLISQFFEKLLSEFEKGTVSEAIALTNNNTDTAWFHQVMRDVQAVCFTRGRIKFLFEGTNKKASPTQGQVFLLFGASSSAICRSVFTVRNLFINFSEPSSVTVFPRSISPLIRQSYPMKRWLLASLQSNSESAVAALLLSRIRAQR